MGISPGVAASERRAQRVRGARARAAADGRPKGSTPARRCGASSPQVVFTTHTPVPAGHDRFSPQLDRGASRAARAKRWASTHDELMALGRVDPDDAGEDVLHDGAGAKLCRRANAVSSLHGQVSRGDVDAALSRAHARSSVPIGHITNGVHVQTWLAPQMRQVYDRHLGPDWPSRAGDARLLGADRRDRRRRAVGDAPDAQGPAHRHRRGGARRDQAERRGESPRVRRAAAARAQPRRADDRLRPPLRHLQARQSDPPGHRSASPRWSTTRRCRCSSCSPARRIRTISPGKEVLQQIAQLTRDPALRRQDRVRRGLRHQRRPAPRAGRRRLAQQPAAAARGLRHQRPEGRAQRRPEPVDPRRLVGRGLRRPERLRDRHGRDAHVDRRARRARRRVAAAACCATK